MTLLAKDAKCQCAACSCLLHTLPEESAARRVSFSDVADVRELDARLEATEATAKLLGRFSHSSKSQCNPCKASSRSHKVSISTLPFAFACLFSALGCVATVVSWSYAGS